MKKWCKHHYLERKTYEIWRYGYHRRFSVNTNLAYKLNKEIIKNEKSPHEKDLARMRMNIIKKAKKRRKLNEQAIKPICK